MQKRGKANSSFVKDLETIDLRQSMEYITEKSEYTQTMMEGKLVRKGYNQ